MHGTHNTLSPFDHGDRFALCHDAPMSGRHRPPGSHHGAGSVLLLTAIAVAVVLVSGILAATRIGQPGSENLVRDTGQTTATRNASTSTPTSPTPAPSPSTPPPAPAPTLALTWTGTSWVQIEDEVQHVVLFTGTAEAGTVKKYTGERYSVVIGNASAVEVSTNGSQPKILGGDGQVARFTVSAK